MASRSVHQVEIDGRVVRAFDVGPATEGALVFHTGTPSPPVHWRLLEEAAIERGLRLVTYERPGYGGSSRSPRRRVADAAGDVEAILDHLEIDDFIAVGWSGGGPHALACAAILSARCRAAATIGSLSPLDPRVEAWWDETSEPNEAAFRAAVDGEHALRTYLEPGRARFLTVTAAQLAESLGDLVSGRDRVALTADLADMLARSRRQAAATGFDGWVDDLVAVVHPWGFDLASIDRPVTVWHGQQDQFVPVHHGSRLSAEISTVTARILEEEGHLSIASDGLAAVIDDLVPWFGP